MQNDWKKAEKALKNDGVGVIPTDTLYGLVGSVFSKKAVDRIYKIKGRNDNKPFIVLISSFRDLEKFGIKINKEEAKILEKFWPGKVSVILSCKSVKWKYIHKGVKSIAFRMIGKKNKNLFEIIKKVGPLVAPSANREGEKPAENIDEAKKYFGDNVDFYINGRRKIGEPSTLISVKDGKIEILRQGVVKINNKK